MLKAGDVLGGDVRLDELIGEGACGWVYRGQQLQLERTVAVKVLKVEDLTEPVASWKRFQREARVLADLSHPGIVQIHTIGHHERWPYFIMEYLRGRSVAVRLKDERQLSIAGALDIIEQACDALDAAHDRGVVHRDLKPANLFETNDGRIKVIDFGVARLFAGDVAQRGRFTETGVLVGTPAFMAPEQARDKDVDGRTDVYALGVILYQLLTGRLPFDDHEHSTDIALLGRIAAGVDRPIAVQDHRGDIPEAVAALVAQCMSYHAANRYQTAKALRGALRALQLGLRPAAKTADRTLSAPAAPPSVLSAPRRDPAAPSSRMPTLEAEANAIHTSPSAVTLTGRRSPEPQPSGDFKITAPETPRSMGVARPISRAQEPEPPSTAQPPATRPRSANARSSAAAVAGVIAGVAIGLCFLILRNQFGPVPARVATETRPAAGASTPPPLPAHPVANVAAAPTSRMGHVLVVTMPRGARVIVAGTVVGETPVDVTGTADQLQRVRLELAGFAPRDEAVLPSTDGGEAQFTMKQLVTHHRRAAATASKTAPSDTKQATPHDHDGIANPFEE